MIYLFVKNVNKLNICKQVLIPTHCLLIIKSFVYLLDMTTQVVSKGQISAVVIRMFLWEIYFSFLINLLDELKQIALLWFEFWLLIMGTSLLFLK